MPPKEVTNIINGTLYFEDENGELRPIIDIRDVELTTDTDPEDAVPRLLSMQSEYHFGFDLDRFTYNMLVRSHQNNYRRLHGLRPVRHKVQRHKPENSLFAVKCMMEKYKRRIRV